jgi:crotonobetaine/carnitine-CoA ligase
MPLGGDRLPAHPVDPADTMAILYTSGTTGAPKGVCCPHAQFFWWGVLVGEQLGLGPGDTAYTVLPLFHTNALNAVAQVLASGARYAFGPRFSASGFWGEARAVGATVTYLLGAMVHILMKAPPSGSDRDHAVRIALSPATPAELATGFQERFGVVLMDGYGSTETNLVTSNLIGGHTPGTMGRPAPEFEVRAADDHDEELPPGVPGELLVRPREPFSCATGYWRRPEATVAAWRNLWFHTGDRVVREPDGTLRFVDRLKDAIRRRGENVSSFEVEQALVSHPDVESAAVVPVPSELSEDEVMAFVVPRAGRRLDPVDLVRHCEPHLAYFAIPRFVEVVDALPLTENGKVRKHVLRERGRGPATWDREAAGVVLRR